MRGRWSRIASSAALFTLLGSCRLVAGIDDRVLESEPRAAASSCSYVADAPKACAACTGSNGCCDALGRCKEDESCSRVLGCLDACTGDVASVTACRLRCGRLLPTSFNDTTADLLSCQASHCGDACALSCGGYIHPNALCEACAKESCCEQASACASSRECLSLTTCDHACVPGDGPCKTRCTSDHAAGNELRTELATCIQRSCAAPCYDSAWACLGKPSLQPPAGPYPIALQTIDLATSSPLSGIDVHFCPDTDEACDVPTLATTDAAGRAQLTVADLHGGCLFLTSDAIASVCASIIPNASTTASVVVPVVRRVDRDRVFGQTWRAGTAAVLAFAHDCAGQPGAGVELTTQGEGRPLYWRAGRFVMDAFDTDVSGMAAIVDFSAPGSRIIRAELTASLPPLGQAKAILRSDTISYVSFGP